MFWQQLRLILKLNGADNVEYGKYQTGKNGNNLNADTAGSEHNVGDEAESRNNDTQNHHSLRLVRIVPVLLALCAGDDFEHSACNGDHNSYN